MYKVLIPRNWEIPEGRLILRLKNRNSKNSVSKRIIKGRPTVLKIADMPAKSVGDVIAWVDVATAESTKPLTTRVNLASLKRVKNIRSLIYGEINIPDLERLLNEQTAALNGLRWIAPNGPGDIFRISHRILNDFGTIGKKGVNNVDHLFNSMRNFQNINDGTEACNQIAYVHMICQIRQVAQQHMQVSDTFSRSAIVSGNENMRKVLLGLLYEIKQYSELPALQTIAASIESLLYERCVSAESFTGLRESKSLNSLRLTGGLSGIGSYGDRHHGDSIAMPEIKYTGIGTDVHSRINNGKTTVIYSANPKFLKAYLFRLVYYISLFPEFDYHFHLIASAEDCAKLAELVLESFVFNQKIRQKPTSTAHISFSFSSVPLQVEDETSYFASARYLVAGQIMNITKAPVWVQDVDLFPTADTNKYQDQLKKHDVTLYVSGFLRGLFPWTRFLAGNVYVNNTQKGKEFLESAAKYLCEWVTVPNSWTVDQNALTYAIDYCGPNLKLGNMKELKVPLTQSKLAIRIES